MSGSSLTARGSTRRWRRIRRLVLERDRYACRFVVDEETGRTCGAFASHVHHVDGRANGADDNPDRLAAACGPHNLAQGSTPGLVARTPNTPRRKAPTRWSW